MLENHMNEEYIKLAFLATVYLTLFMIEHVAPYFKNRQAHTTFRTQSYIGRS